jgi:hypothetical protein
VGQVFCANCGAVGKSHLGLAVSFRPTGIDPRPHDWRDYSEYETWKASTPRLPTNPAPGRAIALTPAGSRVMALVAGLAVAVTPMIAVWQLSRHQWVSAIGPVLAFLAFAILGRRALPSVLPKLGFPAWQAYLLWLPVVGGIMLGRWAWRWAENPGATLGGPG